MNISAKVIADSIGNHGIRITSFELEFPRIILAEFNTHRMFSRNAASTRAVPLSKQLEYLSKDFFKPTPFTKNKPGMASNEAAEKQSEASSFWNCAMESAKTAVSALNDIGISKQHAGRIIEPFSFIKVVCTSTDYANFFHLRRHPDAQPEIHELAEKMWNVREASTPNLLSVGEWHLPYIDSFRLQTRSGLFYRAGEDVIDLETAKMISASLCAQVSYRKADESIEKAKSIYARLVESKPCHSSPMEHQATPMDYSPDQELWAAGVTHVNQYDKFSGNFRGWIQMRHLIPDNTCFG